MDLGYSVFDRRLDEVKHDEHTCILDAEFGFGPGWGVGVSGSELATEPDPASRCATGAGTADPFLEKSDQIGGYPHDPGHVVDTFWDIGHSDYTSIWFYQNIHGRNIFIDYFQYNGELAPFYAKKLQEKQKKHGYVYGKHYFPHDTGNTTFIGNPRDTLQKLGVTATVGQRVTEKIDAIDAARIKLPTCFFDKKKTVKGLNALKNYRKKWNTSMGEFSDTQSVHDWASHGADAFMEFATNYTGPVSQTPLKYKNDRIYA